MKKQFSLILILIIILLGCSTPKQEPKKELTLGEILAKNIIDSTSNWNKVNKPPYDMMVVENKKLNIILNLEYIPAPSGKQSQGIYNVSLFKDSIKIELESDDEERIYTAVKYNIK